MKLSSGIQAGLSIYIYTRNGENCIFRDLSVGPVVKGLLLDQQIYPLIGSELIEHDLIYIGRSMSKK